MKVLDALQSVMKKTDKVPLEKLEISQVQNTIEQYCKEFLVNTDDVVVIEIPPDYMQAGIAALQNQMFLEKYEFQQKDVTLFEIKLREIDII